jgi:hypothetical protein
MGRSAPKIERKREAINRSQDWTIAPIARSMRVIPPMFQRLPAFVTPGQNRDVSTLPEQLRYFPTELPDISQILRVAN